MIVAEDVQGTVYDETGELATNRFAAHSGIVSGDVGAYIDVADNRIRRGRARESERDDVGWSGVTQVQLVQPRHRAPVEKRDGDERVSNFLGAQNGLDDLLRPSAAQRSADAIRGDIDVETHTDANSDVTPPLAAG